MELRRLSDSGIVRFQAYIDGLRSGHATPPPVEILNSEELTDSVTPRVRVGDQPFASRYELGVYLVDALAALDQQRISRDIGMWSWLALFYFEQLCPRQSDGQRSLRENYTYILSQDFRHYPRHAIRTTYYFVQQYGSQARFMFSKPLHERGEIAEQLVARQELAGCPAVFEAASRLYDDPDRRTFKSGAAGVGKGSIRRFVRVLQQFQMTYDLFSMSASDLLRLLPSEFDRFRTE